MAKLGTYYHHVTSQVYDQAILDRYPSGMPSKVPRLDPRTRDGELMWPERYDQEAVDSMQIEMGTMWSAAQQQWPVTEAGGVIAESYLRYWKIPHAPRNPTPDQVLSHVVPDIIQLHLDGRFKSAADAGSYVVIQAWARKGHAAYLVGMFRQRVGLPDTTEALLRMIADWRPALTVLELKASGQFIFNTLKEKIPGIVGYSPIDSKRARLEAQSSHFRAGNVYLPEPGVYDWAEQAKNEIVAFPFSANDDIPDMASQALTYLFPLGRQQSYAELLKNL
ncbi:MAG: hypothetical protein HC814_01080 [Rhodobacteraceae bacterium]|nr:hypothetical protein [Paracoccaceae bacterium]